jgi:hypothetical protein
MANFPELLQQRVILVLLLQVRSYDHVIRYVILFKIFEEPWQLSRYSD